MAQSYQIPGGIFLNDTGSSAYQMPGYGFVIETTTTTSTYTKSRKVHPGMSTGGAAASRGSVVNSGGV